MNFREKLQGAIDAYNDSVDSISKVRGELVYCQKTLERLEGRLIVALDSLGATPVIFEEQKYSVKNDPQNLSERGVLVVEECACLILVRKPEEEDKFDDPPAPA